VAAGLLRWFRLAADQPVRELAELAAWYVTGLASAPSLWLTDRGHRLPTHFAS
jgi:hypothetical protein